MKKIYAFLLLFLTVPVSSHSNEHNSTFTKNALISGFVVTALGSLGWYGFNKLKTKCLSVGKLFKPGEIKETFDSVAGATEAKAELQVMINFLKNPEKLKRVGAKNTHGILLSSKPGNGKTLLARAVAGEANCPIIVVSAQDLTGTFGESRIHYLFKQARKQAPCILFIDEIDAIRYDKTLLTEMDGFEQLNNLVIVIGATNRPEELSPALTRSGRFDRHIKIPLPDLICRQAILELYAKNYTFDDNMNFQKVAKNDHSSIATEDIEEAINILIMGDKNTTTKLSPYEKKVTAYHEAGHALVALLLPDVTTPLHKVTIEPRGDALGVTHFVPNEEKHSVSKEDILGRIKVGLGGRIAEEIVFKKISAGAFNDLENTSYYARLLVRYFGMSEKLGPITYLQGPGEYVYSEHIAAQIDQEVQAIITTCYQEVKALLTKNRKTLDLLAQALINKETLYAEEIYELLNITPRTPENTAAQ